jgi:PAS domain S-box-containing protein
MNQSKEQNRKPKTRNHVKHRSRQDAIVIVTASLVLLTFAITQQLDVFENLARFTREHEHWELNELIAVLLFSGIGWFVFAIRRWKEAKQEVEVRERAEFELHQLNEQLENQVLDRTRELSESKERLQQILSSMPAIIYTAASDGLFPRTFVSENVTSLLGYPPRDFTSTPEFWMSRIHPEDISTVLKRLWSIDENVEQVMEYRFAHGDGGFRWLYDRVKLIRREDGTTTEILGFWADVTDRKRAEERAQEVTARLNALVEASPDVIYFKDAERRHLLVNRAYEEFTGLDRYDVAGKPAEQFLPPFLAEQTIESDESVLETGTARTAEQEATDRDGKRIVFETMKFPVFDELGRLLGLGGISRNITDRKLMEEELERKQQSLELVLEGADLGLWDWDLRNGKAFRNRRTAELYGISHEALSSTFDQWRSRIHAEDRARALEAFDGHLAGLTPAYEAEYRLVSPSGSSNWVLGKGKVVERDSEGRPLRIAGTLLDVSERKQAEAQIRAALREKEVLLREIHHRVKNNLAIISSLLRLQSRYAEEESQRQLLEDAQVRIKSMALAHEMLYQSQDFAQIDVGGYLSKLLDHLFSAVPVGGRRVECRKDFGTISFGLDTAVPLGFIVTELVSNCLKHAFPDGQGGRVDVALTERHENEFELVVRDDGVGIPADFDEARPRSLGLELVDIWVKQLDGRMEIGREGGTEVNVMFRESHQ